jgi:GDP-L-fucose synthase
LKILVTGGSGQLGRSIQKSVTKLNDSKETYFFVNSKNADLTESNQVHDLLSTIKPDLIIHTAAKVGGILENLKNSDTILQSNLQIDLNLFKSAVKLGISKILLIGSSCVYPVDSRRPLLEHSLFEGKVEETNRSYALSKLVNLDLALNLNKKFDTNFKTIILSNLYGPFDSYSSSRSHIVAAAFNKIAVAKSKNLDKVKILGDGTPKREFTYSIDVSDWIVENISRITDFPQVMNLSSGMEYTIADYYLMVAKSLNYSGSFEFDLQIPNGVMSKLMDSTFARDNFDWYPKTDFETGIRFISQLDLRSLGIDV